MKLKGKLLLSILGLTTAIVMTTPLTSRAALQANGGTPATKQMRTWLLETRKMEATGGTLGLMDTINGTTLLSTAEKSNNLDIHMELNTEFGAMAILSASAYGNQKKINDGDTTTGNKSGVLIKINKEWVSSFCSTTGLDLGKSADGRYKNVYKYEASGVGKIGDATAETKGWHGTTTYSWLGGNYSNEASTFLRAYQGSIFSYYGQSNPAQGTGTHYNYYYPSRAVICVGTGL